MTTERPPGQAEHVPVWMDAMIDQRIMQVLDVMPPGLLEPFDVLHVQLTEPDDTLTDEQFAQWDQSCDRCKKFCPDTLLGGYVERRRGEKLIVFTYGACAACMAQP